MNPLAAFGVASVAALGGRRLGWLTVGGSAAALVAGTVVLSGGGLGGGALLALFFVSGSLLTRWSERDGLVGDDAKGGPRDAQQVAANGLWATLGALVIPMAPTIGWSVMVGALAAAQADTWATEIGARSPHPPRLITTGEPVAQGTSGGVTALGTGGAVGGAALMAAASWLAGAPPAAVASAMAGGILGMGLDSLLGATAQGRFESQTASGTRQAPVADAPDQRLIRGFVWCTNDVVNFLGTGTGAVIGLALGWVWTRP